MGFDDPIERRKWLARLVASAKGHARKAGRPFELTTAFIETLYAQQEGRCDAWTARYAERIAAAEALLTSLPENERPKQRRHIASLSRALTLGPQGLKAAADRAKRSRSEPLV
jgi:hypothetical protein